MQPTAEPLMYIYIYIYIYYETITTWPLSLTQTCSAFISFPPNNFQYCKLFYTTVVMVFPPLFLPQFVLALKSVFSIRHFVVDTCMHKRTYFHECSEVMWSMSSSRNKQILISIFKLYLSYILTRAVQILANFLWFCIHFHRT